MKQNLFALISVFLLLNTGLFAQPLKSIETLDEDRRTILENLYDGFSGDSWGENTKWKTASPISEWSGIRVRDIIWPTRAHWITVDLKSNNLILKGLMYSVADLSSLYDAAYNASIDTIDLSENYLTYADLKTLRVDDIVVPNHAKEITYSPQNRIPLKTTTIEVEENNGSTINIENYYAGSRKVQSLPGGMSLVTYSGMYPRDPGNVYSWWKKIGMFWMSVGSGKELILPQTPGSYQYYCHVTNPDFPELALSTQTITVNVVSVDREALAALYMATDGDNWTNNTNWLDDTAPLDTWYGVTTDPISGRVTELDLHGNNLNGNLPDDFFNADELTHLQLSYNNLTGSIPVAIGNLSNLEFLGLYECGLNGQIPEIIGNLSNLSVLALYNNDFSGTVPASFSNLSNLVNLTLHGNSLLGDLPELSSVSGYLRIENNKFTFDNMQQINSTATNFIYSPQADVVLLPDEYVYNINDNISIDCGLDASNSFQWYKDGITPADNGHTLDIDNAQMNDAGQYHCEITNAAFPDLTLSTTVISIDIVNDIDRQALEDLYIATGGDNWTDNTNWLNDDVPLDQWFGIQLNSAGRVKHINLFNNNLQGQLTASLSNLSELEVLSIWNNDLAGPIPSSYGQFSKLTVMTMSNSGLTGSIPSELGNLSSLLYLNLLNNQLEGSIPSTFSNLSKLNDLVINLNNLSGELPDLSMVEGMLHVNQNRFVYADFETGNISPSADFKYLGQQNIEPSEREFSVDEGDDLAIDIEDLTSLRHPSNVYHWYKGDEEISDTKTLNIAGASLDDAGIYTCEVSNPGYPELDLVILDITISVVEAPNQAPVAIAGDDQSVGEQTIVTLDGGSSYDPDSDAITFSWTAPAGIVLDDNTLQMPQFTAPEINGDTTIIFSLLVNDGILSDIDSVFVTIQNSTSIILSSESDVKIWPNPAIQNINVLFKPRMSSSDNKLKALVFDLSGKLVAQENIIKQSDNTYLGSIRVSHLEKGVYFVKSGNENAPVMHKIIIK